jgi:hypothetical protein
MKPSIYHYTITTEALQIDIKFNIFTFISNSLTGSQLVPDPLNLYIQSHTGG